MTTGVGNRSAEQDHEGVRRDAGLGSLSGAALSVRFCPARFDMGFVYGVLKMEAPAGSRVHSNITTAWLDFGLV